MTTRKTDSWRVPPLLPQLVRRRQPRPAGLRPAVITNEANRYQGVTKQLDNRVCEARQRIEAVRKSTELIEPMLRRALAAGVRAKCLLMGSLFGMPAIISNTREHLHVICMVKHTPKILYDFGCKRRTVEDIYRRLRKRGLAKIKTSAVVTMNDGQSARLVFVKNRGKGDWLALLCTDTSLPETEVVRIYGKRWDIEVFFRTIEQHLDLEPKKCQARDFDATENPPPCYFLQLLQLFPLNNGRFFVASTRFFFRPCLTWCIPGQGRPHRRLAETSQRLRRRKELQVMQVKTSISIVCGLEDVVRQARTEQATAGDEGQGGGRSTRR